MFWIDHVGVVASDLNAPSPSTRSSSANRSTGSSGVASMPPTSPG